MRILIVEDDRSIRDTLSQVITSFGHSPFTATNEEEALRQLTSVKPDVVLLDLLLEGHIATPFIDAAKQITDGSMPGIIVLSAMHGAEKIAEAHKVNFLAKPFEIDSLHQMLDGK